MSEDAIPYRTKNDKPRMDMNKVFVSGNLTNDVELKHTPNGKAVVHFRVAINDSYLDGAGKRHELVVFIDVEVWGRQAENCGSHLSKGSRVVVQGKLKMDQWEKDGKRMTKIEIRADQVIFMNGKTG